MGHCVQEDTKLYGRAVKNILTGDFLPAGEGIVVSQRIAKLINAELNKYIVLTIYGSQGSFYYLDYLLVGTFKSDSTDFDDNHIFISHKNAEELLYLPGKSIEIRVNLESPNQADKFMQAIQPLITKYELEAATWRDIFGSFTMLIELFDFFMLFINLVVLIGAPLAQKMGLSVGDIVDITAYNINLHENYIKPEVVGIFNFGYPVMDENIIFFTEIETADSLLSLEGAVTRLVIKLEPGYSAEELLPMVEKICEGTNYRAYLWRALYCCLCMV